LAGYARLVFYFGITNKNDLVEEYSSVRAVLERVEMKTTDGVNIIGDLYQPINSNGSAVILLHMMNKDKASWYEFGKKLVDKGYVVLAIDLRGHGESVQQLDRCTVFKNGCRQI